jgi:hypothetical protein
MATTYQIKKKAIGGYAVAYDCPHCDTSLTSSLNEAGTSQPCPTCTRPFVVPGKVELDKLKDRQALERRAKEQQDLERARQNQLADENARMVRAAELEKESAQRKYLESHCPYCWEEITPGVKKCKSCHEYLDAALREQATKQEVVRFSPTLVDVFWLVVKFWTASLLFGLVCWMIVLFVGAMMAGSAFSRH